MSASSSNAIVMVTVEHINPEMVAQALLRLPGVKDVYSVTGRYDLVVILSAKTNEDVVKLVTGDMRAIPGLSHAEAMFAFKSHARHTPTPAHTM